MPETNEPDHPRFSQVINTEDHKQEKKVNRDTIIQFENKPSKLLIIEIEDNQEKMTEPAQGIATRMSVPPHHQTSQKNRNVMINYNQKEKFISNHVNTAKYTFFTFLPFFLYEQFRRYSNVFFLCIIVLQLIPDVSPTGRYTTLVPFVAVLTVSAIKEFVEDFKRHKSDNETNAHEVEVFRNDLFVTITWKDLKVGEFVRIYCDCPIPADIVLYSSSEHMGICYIETANLDGETNLKVRQAISQTAKMIETEDFISVKGFIECEVPNKLLYQFAGSIKLEPEDNSISLGPDQLLLRGAMLRNTTWIFGQVIYTGFETKLMMNSTKAPLKRSTLDKLTNYKIIFLFILLVFIAFISAVFSEFYVDTNIIKDYIGSPKYIEYIGGDSKASHFFWTFLTFIILFNNLIPISLSVTLEVVRFVQAKFINNDKDMYHAETDTPAMARTSNLNEELGQIRYIFSDKTGTLTKNIMEFKGCSVGGVYYSPTKLFSLQADPNFVSPIIKDLVKDKIQRTSIIREFLTLLAICHNVIPERKFKNDKDELIYHASSPDERALAEGAKILGFEFQTRTPTFVEILAMGKLERYEILNLIEFNSTRKRMTVIVLCPDEQIRLYCKGADSVIYDLLDFKGNNEKLMTVTHTHLEVFAIQGLRTLCCAMKTLTKEEYDEWNVIFTKASNTIMEREEAINKAVELIEKDLILLGATAIEDKLQDFVPETIAAFLEAGIKVWVLTGDKQETAINIGNSCKLLDPSMTLLIINQEQQQHTLDCIVTYARELSVSLQINKKEMNELEAKNAAVIIDGMTLVHALKPEIRQSFVTLCCHCKAVVVCRASPLQKAEIVELITKSTGAVTLAIGDGANDVAMIQKANVGIGISGNEGLQAAFASDYAIAQFYFLKKLLFVHGAYSHERIRKTIFYSFYKNICLYIIELWFAIYSAWSGQVIFERWTIGCYNLFFTCLQPLAIGIFERNCNIQLRMQVPALYLSSSNGSFSLKQFFIWMLIAVYHSISLFWLSKLFVGDGVIWENGKEGSFLVLGNCIYTYVVITVSLKEGLETKSWTRFTQIAIWGSMAIWMGFFAIYSTLWRILPHFGLGNDIFGVAVQVYTSPVFWIGIIVIPIATLIPDLIFKVVSTSMYSSIVDMYREGRIIAPEPETIIPVEIIYSSSSQIEGAEDLIYPIDTFASSQTVPNVGIRHGYKINPNDELIKHKKKKHNESDISLQESFESLDYNGLSKDEQTEELNVIGPMVLKYIPDTKKISKVTLRTVRPSNKLDNYTSPVTSDEYLSTESLESITSTNNAFGVESEIVQSKETKLKTLELPTYDQLGNIIDPPRPDLEYSSDL